MSDLFAAFFSGDLTPTQRVWTAAMPALLLLTYVVGGTLVFAGRNLVRGRFVDREMEARGSSLLLGMWVRQYFAWLMAPWVSLLLRLQLPANAITTLSLLLATAAGVALAAGRFSLGGWLFVASGACDFFDGRIARITKQAGPQGALLDSVLDRYVEAAVFVGLAWFYRDSWVLAAVLFALVGSLLVPYIRARGEGLGARFDNVGLMQRPERIVILGASVALSPIVEAIVVPAEPHPIHRVAVVGIILVAAATHVTSLQRLAHGLASLGAATKDTGLNMLGRGSLGRTTIAAALATGVDFAFFATAVEVGAISPVAATFLGAVVGAVVNFSINRVWTFGSDDSYAGEAARYAFVSGTSAVLNAGGVAVLLLLPGILAPLVWVIVRAAVFVTWNYPLQRDYVFANAATPLMLAPAVKEDVAAT